MFKPGQIVKNLSYRWEYILILRKLWLNGEPNGFIKIIKDNRQVDVPKIWSFSNPPENKKTFDRNKTCTLRKQMKYFKNLKVPFAVVEARGKRGELVYELWVERLV